MVHEHPLQEVGTGQTQQNIIVHQLIPVLALHDTAQVWLLSFQRVVTELIAPPVRGSMTTHVTDNLNDRYQPGETKIFPAWK